MKKFKNISVLALIAVTISSCYRSPNDTILYEDLDLVSTNYDVNRLDGAESYPNEYQTFVIADSIQVASNVEDVDDDVVNDPTFRLNIRNVINTNMLNLGYVPTTNATDTPDIYVNLLATYINQQGVNYYPIYWGGGGWGYGYPYYGWGGGYYYPSYSYVPSYYSYDQGSLIIDWMDIKNAEVIPDNDTSYFKVDVVYDMTISGLIRNASDADRNTRFEAAINQGFKQSPYLKK